MDWNLSNAKLHKSSNSLFVKNKIICKSMPKAFVLSLNFLFCVCVLLIDKINQFDPIMLNNNASCCLNLQQSINYNYVLHYCAVSSSKHRFFHILIHWMSNNMVWNKRMENLFTSARYVIHLHSTRSRMLRCCVYYLPITLILISSSSLY
jgi:hypothetical protein